MNPQILETEISRSGQPVLKLNGRLLASSFDPLKEAAAWAARALETVGDKGAAIVVGAGCGYHLAALKALSSQLQIVAVEINAEVAAAALKWNPALAVNEIVLQADPIQLTEAPALRDAMAGTYAVLTHAPTAQANETWALQSEAFLLARDKLSFLLQLRMRPDLYALLDPEKIAAVGNEAISIKTLQKMFATPVTSSRERRLWRVLEELVL